MKTHHTVYRYDHSVYVYGHTVYIYGHTVYVYGHTVYLNADVTILPLLRNFVLEIHCYVMKNNFSLQLISRITVSDAYYILSAYIT